MVINAYIFFGNWISNFAEEKSLVFKVPDFYIILLVLKMSQLKVCFKLNMCVPILGLIFTKLNLEERQWTSLY